MVTNHAGILTHSKTSWHNQMYFSWSRPLLCRAYPALACTKRYTTALCFQRCICTHSTSIVFSANSNHDSLSFLCALMQHAVILLQSPKVSQLGLSRSACSKLNNIKTTSLRCVPSAPIRSKISAAAFRSPCSAYALSRMLYVCSSGLRPSWCSLIRYCSS